MNAVETFIPVKDACEMVGDNLNTARRHQSLYVRDGGSVPLVKQDRRWYVSSVELATAIGRQTETRQKRHADTVHYQNQVLQTGDGTVQVEWGSYTVTPGLPYHTTYNSFAEAYDRVKRRGGPSGGAVCNTCWGRVSTEYGPSVPCGCHSCEDWNAGHEDTYPVLSRSCPTCNWKV